MNFKTIILLKAFLAISLYANAQGNCDSILKAYYASAPNVEKLEYELSFCRGARSALNQNYLSICTIGHPKDISPCTYFAYERYSVKLCIVENPSRVDEAEAENAGHNFIMRQRIKQQMPDKAKLVGVEDPEYFVISDNLNTEIEKVLQVSERETVQPKETFTSEKAKKKAEKKRLKAERKAAKKAQKNQGKEPVKPQEKTVNLSLEKGKYAYLSEAKLTDLKSGKVYKFSDLYNGIDLVPFSEGENRKLGLQLDITNIDTSKICKNQLPKRKIWAIQVPLKGKI
ncbi:MAG: hypothetical protein ACXWDO_04170 [Bacteroidia bacterium]